MSRKLRVLTFLGLVSFLTVGWAITPALSEEPSSPALGYAFMFKRLI